MNSTRNLFSVQNEVEPPHQKIQTIKLTPRQYKLHDLLLEHSKSTKSRLTHREILERLDKYYHYFDEKIDHPNRPFNNMHARRQLSDDLDAITTYGGFHKVYIGGRYATSQLEIDIHLLKEEIRLKKEWRKLQIKRKKAGLDGQIVMQFTGYEKEEWESYIRDEELKLKRLEDEWDGKGTTS